MRNFIFLRFQKLLHATNRAKEQATLTREALEVVHLVLSVPDSSVWDAAAPFASACIAVFPISWAHGAFLGLPQLSLHFILIIRSSCKSSKWFASSPSALVYFRFNCIFRSTCINPRDFIGFGCVSCHCIQCVRMRTMPFKRKRKKMLKKFMSCQFNISFAYKMACKIMQNNFAVDIKSSVAISFSPIMMPPARRASGIIRPRFSWRTLHN